MLTTNKSPKGPPNFIRSRKQGSLTLILAENVARIRKAKGLSQDELSKAVGWGQNAIWRVETGRESLRLMRVEHLAKALQTTVQALLEPYEEYPFTKEAAEALISQEREVKSDNL